MKKETYRKSHEVKFIRVTQNICIHTRHCTRIETENGTGQNNKNLRPDLSKYVFIFSNIYKLFFVGFAFIWGGCWGFFVCLLFYEKLNIPIMFTCFDSDLL